jgi:hypothetical protein
MLIKKFALQELSEKAQATEQQYKKNRKIII